MDFFFVGYIFFVFSDLWNNTSKNSLSNKTVHIDVLGNYYDVTTDEKGIASIKLDNITNKEDKPITVSYSFDGDNKYFASNGSVDVNAHRIDTSFSNASSIVTNGSYFNVTLFFGLFFLCCFCFFLFFWIVFLFFYSILYPS